ncbi:methyltransferase type 11 [Streptomyces agglomeratus]|uniref:methyltransferase domain-containing protein n=1 Tax=Streptomyces agglomeratus TaxID=285458 RepID=UPI0008690CD3|nr:methyltransferase domain-containing protein [Streptomyces agglomeratus]OEJ61041.1 methyltransferase type 11 [Streptomyces agglomeratus]
MTPTLVRHHRHGPNTASSPATDAGARARDWAEIQERMLVPLYEAAYERLEVGPATRLLGLGCGSGLALLIATSRGAHVTGVEADPGRVALARERLRADGARTGGSAGGSPGEDTRLYEGESAAVCDDGPRAYNLVTAFEPLGCAAGDSEELATALESAIPLAERGSEVVLAGWGPPERCATSSVLRVASRLTETLRATGGGRGWRPALRDDLEDVASRAGLKPDGSGRVACPFGYADMDSAVRGLLSTGLFDAAARATDPGQVEKELTEALHPHVRRDGTVWMSNVFRYLIARTP